MKMHLAAIYLNAQEISQPPNNSPEISEIVSEVQIINKTIKIDDITTQQTHSEKFIQDVKMITEQENAKEAVKLLEQGQGRVYPRQT